MLQKQKEAPVSRTAILLLCIINVLIVKVAFVQNENWYWALVVTFPLLLIAIIDVRQPKYAIVRNYPFIVPLGYSLKITVAQPRQYFLEMEVDDKSRLRHRHLITYQREENESRWEVFGARKHPAFREYKGTNDSPNARQMILSYLEVTPDQQCSRSFKAGVYTIVALNGRALSKTGVTASKHMHCTSYIALLIYAPSAKEKLDP